MIYVRKAGERGHFDHGWLNTYHTFSFSEYYDPNFMGFRHLRVINEDRVDPGMGFPTHPHRDMEIISYVLEGGLAHKDSMGNGSTIKPGEVQRMSAGTGITHSEYNHSEDEKVHFLQIWVMPGQRGLRPSYEQKYYDQEDKYGKLMLVASPDGKDNSVQIHQDTRLYASVLDKGQTVEYKLDPNRNIWLQVVRGGISINGQALEVSDGAAIAEVPELTIVGDDAAEFLLFDLA
jgi:redox-sensitive bicupin YhaK (pirin superfamily)